METEALRRNIAERMKKAQAAQSVPDDNALRDNILQRLRKMQADQAALDSPIEAGLTSFADTATMGYLPQLQAMAQKGIEYLTPESDEDKALRETGFNIQPEEESYVQARDKFRQREQALSEANPTASMVGTGLGIGVSAIAPGALANRLGIKAAQGLGLGSKLSRGIGTGALYGAAQNPGDVEGQYAPLQLAERAEGAKSGAITGGLVAGGTSLVGAGARAAKGAASRAKNYAWKKAYKAAGAMTKDFRDMFDKNATAKIGRTLDKYNIVEMGDDLAAINKKVTQTASQLGDDIGKVYESADDFFLNVDKSKLSPAQLNKIKKSQIDMENFKKVYLFDAKKRLAGTGNNRSVLKQLEKTLDELAENGKDVPMRRLQEIRNSIADKAKFHRANTEKLAEKEYRKLYGKLNELIDNRMKVADSVMGTKYAPSLRTANKDYSTMQEILDVNKKLFGREEANQAFGLSEKLGGGFGATLGGMVGGVPGAIAGGVLGGVTSKVARRYGNAATASLANKAARVLEKNQGALNKFSQPLIEAAKKSPRDFVIAVEVMKNDPSFSKAVHGAYRIENREK